MNQQRFDLYKELVLNKFAVIVYTEDLKKVSIQELLAKSKQKKCLSILIEESCWAEKLNFNNLCYDAKKFNISIGTIISDYFLYPFLSKLHAKINNLDYIFSCHEQGIPFIIRNCPKVKHVLYLPLSIRSGDYLDRPAKDIDILFTGSGHFEHPHRNRIYRVLNKAGFDVCRLEHPGTRQKEANGKVYGRSYIDYLKRSYFVVACTTKFNISARKYWEIMASSATVIGNITGLREHADVEMNLVNISISATDDDIVKIVEESLNFKEEYLLKAKEMAPYIVDKYSTESVALNLYRTVQSLIENETLTYSGRATIKQQVADKIRGARHILRRW